MAQFTSLSQATETNAGVSDLNDKLAEISDKLDAVVTAQQAAAATAAASAAATTSTAASA
jgi:flagellar hook assembly protein FlgD